MEKKQRIKNLIILINNRLLDLQVLKGGIIMHNDVFKLMLIKHPELKKEWDVLNDRKFHLRRKLWKLERIV